MELLSRQLETQVCCLRELRQERYLQDDDVMGLMRSSRVMVWECRKRYGFILQAGPQTLMMEEKQTVKRSMSQAEC